MRRVYTLLLSVYPRGFRERFRDELLFAFTSGLDAARGAGTGAAVRFVALSAADEIGHGPLGELTGRRQVPALLQFPAGWASVELLGAVDSIGGEQQMRAILVGHAPPEGGWRIYIVVLPESLTALAAPTIVSVLTSGRPAA